MWARSLWIGHPCFGGQVDVDHDAEGGGDHHHRGSHHDHRSAHHDHCSTGDYDSSADDDDRGTYSRSPSGGSEPAPPTCPRAAVERDESQLDQRHPGHHAVVRGSRGQAAYERESPRAPLWRPGPRQ